MLEEETIRRRLSFIKYLYSSGLNNSKQPMPMASTCILSFHDCVELFLYLIAEHLDVARSGIGFMQYWEVIGQGIDGDLSHKESMRRLNNARVSLKHHGMLPAQSTIDEIKGTINSFFIDNTSSIFDFTWETVSMNNLIQCEDCRNSMIHAEEMWRDNNSEECLKDFAKALIYLIIDYENRKRSQYSRSPFFFGGDFTFHRSTFMRIDGELGSFIDNVGSSITAIQEAIKVISLGIDYKKYTKFKLLTPSLRVFGKREIFGRISDRELTEDDYYFCRDFIIESAIVLQEFDYDVDPDESNVRTALI